MVTRSNETATADKEKTVSIDRTFNVPLNEIWKAWTEADSFKKWWGPQGYSCPSCTIDLRVEGKNLASMKGPDGKETWSTATYKEIIPKKKIVYIDSFADSKGNNVSPAYYDMPGDWGSELWVTVTFEDNDGKTKMSLRHEGIPEEMHDDCVTGWQQSFDKMESNFQK